MAIVTAVGATSWGTTLGIILAREGHEVRLLARTEAEASGLECARENARFVPGVQFPESMHALADPAEANDSADLTIFAVPSQTLRANARAVAHAIPDGTVVVSAAKGLELSSGKRMSEVLAEEIPSLDRGVCALSGPQSRARDHQVHARLHGGGIRTTQRPLQLKRRRSSTRRPFVSTPTTTCSESSWPAR